MESRKELTIKEKQQLILEVMKDIDRFCRDHNIPYTISSGTLLGAVRHGGFIPWDDDADMFMLRKDFDRFVATYNSDKYHLLFNTRNENEFFASGYAKVCDPATESADTIAKTNPGIFVDIFPLDAVPEDETLRKKYMHKVMSIHNRLHHRQRKDIVSILKSYRHSLDWWWHKMDTTVRDPQYADSPLVAHIIGTTNYRTVIHKDRFDNLVDIEFEGYPFLGFKDTDGYLTKVYGADYMTPRHFNPYSSIRFL